MTQHSVSDDGDLRKYYAAIPRIVLQLGLNPFELALYVHFKDAAGDKGGACWKSRATIAKESGMSPGMVTKARQSLEMPRPILNGRPLITVTEEPSKSGGKPTCRVTVTDIWAENMSKCSTSPHDVGRVAPSLYTDQRHHTTIATSPHDLKQEPLNNNPEEDTRGFPFDHFAVIEYTETINPEPALAISQAEVIANNVKPSDVSRAVWTNTLRTFKGNGYQPRYAGNAVDRYLKEMAAIEAGKKDSPVQGAKPKTILERIQAGEAL